MFRRNLQIFLSKDSVGIFVTNTVKFTSGSTVSRPQEGSLSSLYFFLFLIYTKTQKRVWKWEDFHTRLGGDLQGKKPFGRPKLRLEKSEINFKNGWGGLDLYGWDNVKW
jgi:hypothetical protein